MGMKKNFILTLLFSLALSAPYAADAKKANLIFYDQIVKLGEKVYLSAKLRESGFLIKPEIGGERIEFFEKSKGSKNSFGIALTGGDGIAVKEISPLKPGLHIFYARIKDSIRYTADESEGMIASLNQKVPIIVVDIDTLSEKEKLDFIFGKKEKELMPLKDSPRVLRKLSRNYNIIYLTNRDELLLPKTRLWLRENRFPSCPIFLIKALEESLTEEYSGRIKEWKKEGWNIKIGIGNSSSHAEAYLDNRIKALIIEDEEELPEKAITVKGWKEIEKIILESQKLHKTVN